MRAFVRMREILIAHKELSNKLAALEKRYDVQFKVVFNSIREILNNSPSDAKLSRESERRMGFRKE